MNAETVLKSINNIAELYNPGIAETVEFQDLAQKLREEIALAEHKKSGKADRFKAALRFSKWVSREQQARPAMAGAYIDKNGRQWILHPAVAVRYDKPYDGLVEAEDGTRPSNADRLVESYDSKRPVKLPDLKDLKIKLKLDKAEGNLDERGRSHTTLDGVTFDTELMIKLLEIVEPKEAYFSGTGNYPVLVVMGKGARGVVCPLRVNG